MSRSGTTITWQRRFSNEGPRVIFVDTSALYAILDRDDAAHAAARQTWTTWLEATDGPRLVTSNYILVESFALVQARLGMAAVGSLADDLIPVLSVEWVTPGDHQTAVQMLRTANRRRLSLVDCTSFQVMHRLAVADVFTFDPHFTEQGFRVLPG
jgi:predicted nucleic acid-binding protein